MRDSNWDLINGTEAHEIEALNYTAQVCVIESFVRLKLYRASHHGDPMCPDEVGLKEMHRAGTLYLLHSAGRYRESDVGVYSNGVLIHTPPPHQHVESYMAGFYTDLINLWESSAPLNIAAFCLWRVNWIHPFKNGNGRSARALAYACLCLKYGFILPGQPTVIDLITENRDGYYAALKEADKSFQDTGGVNLSAMVAYLHGLLTTQIQSIPPLASAP